jgi:hypothetical protein
MNVRPHAAPPRPGLESDPGSWFGHIVPGTCTGGFASWAGSARIIHDDEGAYFEVALA